MVFRPTSSPKHSVVDTPLPRSHLCGLFGRRAILGHQPHLFLTLETGESGKAEFFFPWQIPSLPPASFRRGSSECFSVYAEGDPSSACPSREFRNGKAGRVGLCRLEDPVEQAESLLNKEEEQRPRRSLLGRAWEFPGLPVKSRSNCPLVVQELLVTLARKDDLYCEECSLLNPRGRACQGPRQRDCMQAKAKSNESSDVNG